MAIPVPIRRMMLEAIQRGESIASAARRFEVTQQGLHKLRRTVEERGTLEPEKTGPKGHIKLTAADLQLMREQITINPGITLLQLRDMLEVRVAESTICRTLRKMNLSLKKIADRCRTTSARHR